MSITQTTAPLSAQELDSSSPNLFPEIKGNCRFFVSSLSFLLLLEPLASANEGNAQKAVQIKSLVTSQKVQVLPPVHIPPIVGPTGVLAISLITIVLARRWNLLSAVANAAKKLAGQFWDIFPNVLKDVLCDAIKDSDSLWTSVKRKFPSAFAAQIVFDNVRSWLLTAVQILSGRGVSTGVMRSMIFQALTSFYARTSTFAGGGFKRPQL